MRKYGRQIIQGAAGGLLIRKRVEYEDVLGPSCDRGYTHATSVHVGIDGRWVSLEDSAVSTDPAVIAVREDLLHLSVPRRPEDQCSCPVVREAT